MTTSMPTLAKLGKISFGKSGNGKAKPAIARSAAEKMWLVGGAVAAVLLFLLGYLVFIHGQQKDTSAVHSQIADAKVQNSVLQARLTTLQLENKNLPKYERQLAVAQAALPSTADASAFVRTMQSIGASTGTTVAGVTIAPPVAVQPSTPATDAASSSAAAAPAAAPTATIYSMGITTQVTGSDAALNQFLQQLQAVQPRAVLLTSVGLAADTDTAAPGGKIHNTATQVLNLSMIAFVQPTNLTVPVTPGASPSSSAGS